MLFVIDVGNTNIVLGIYDNDELIRTWRMETVLSRTSDEYGVLIRQFFATSGIDATLVKGCVLSSVVPPMQPMIVSMVERYLNVTPIAIGPGVRTGMPILYENPREVGADRIVNAIAAFDIFHEPTIAVDLGTATTFDAISGAGEYLGGAIFPGVNISMDALYARASRLPKIELAAPPKVIGRNTVSSMQAGIVFGYASMIDGMVHRFRSEFGAQMRVIATGGLARLFEKHCTTIEVFDPDLTLRGLKILYERNRS